jgi:hypothetical protein
LTSYFYGRDDDLQITDVIGKQKHQCRIERRALRLQKLAVRFNDCAVGR